MKRLIYSPDSYEKIKKIKQYLISEYGKETAANITNQLQKQIKNLKANPYLGISLHEIYGIETNFRKLYAVHNHIIYRVEDNNIYIVNIYDEREDFLYKLFGIDAY